MVGLERLSIYFGRFASKISDLKKIHSTPEYDSKATISPFLKNLSVENDS